MSDLEAREIRRSLLLPSGGVLRRIVTQFLPVNRDLDPKISDDDGSAMSSEEYSL